MDNNQLLTSSHNRSRDKNRFSFVPFFRLPAHVLHHLWQDLRPSKGVSNESRLDFFDSSCVFVCNRMPCSRCKFTTGRIFDCSKCDVFRRTNILPQWQSATRIGRPIDLDYEYSELSKLAFFHLSKNTISQLGVSVDAMAAVCLPIQFQSILIAELEQLAIVLPNFSPSFLGAS